MTGTATYLYALARATAAGVLPGVQGVSDAPVRSLARGELGCYVSTVALSEFGEDALRVNLENLAWLERTARRHDEVVQACGRLATIAPVRLATVFADDDSVLRRLGETSVSALDVLTRVEGREEWGVKVLAGPAEDPPARPGDVSGTAYLRRRKHEQAQRALSAQHATKDAEAIYASLAELAAHTRRHPPQDPRLTGDPRPMVLNAAFLLDRDRVPSFRAAVADIAARRPPDSVIVTGPWPPYSFTALDES